MFILARNIFSKAMLLSLLILVTACNQQPKTQPENQIRVGTIAGPDTELLEVAKLVAEKKYNLDVVIVEFTDYAMPNAALNDGSIDANMFQHLPYLKDSKKARNYQIIAIGKTFIFPMGLYSTKVKSLQDIKEGATIAIPNDPTNEARALLLLEEAGLITLKPHKGLKISTHMIASNSKNLKIKPLDAAQLPRVLSDVDLAAINNSYAIPAGLDPTDAVFLEKSDSPYANVLVIRESDKGNPKFKQLLSAIRSKEVMARANQLFNDQAIPAWKTKTTQAQKNN